MKGRTKRWGAAALASALALSFAGATFGAVRREGTWPASDKEKKVSLKLESTSRREAVRKLADAAGWSVVLPTGLDDEIDVVVKDQPADRVLDLILSEGAFVAKRDGNLLSLAKDAVPAAAQAGAGAKGTEADEPVPVPALPPIPPVPPVPPIPPIPGMKMAKKHSDDRFIAGGNARIEKGEEVGDVTVMGGSADIFGHVRGDVSVMGGSVRIHEGAEVDGDVTALGGHIEVKDNARVDGDLNALGGRIDRSARAIIGGSVTSGPSGHVDVDEDDDDERPDVNKDEQPAPNVDHSHHEGFFSSAARRIGSSLTSSALLFAFGAVLLALAGSRMDRLKLEVAAKPMRCFALGVVGLPLTIVVLLAITVALLITIVGIPLACLGFPLGLAALLAATAVGVSAALLALGEILVRHKTQNPYAHLAVGCAVLFVAGALPVAGGIAETVVALVGLGAIIATRAAGLIPPRLSGPKAQPGGDAPYRAPAEV